MFQTKAVMKIKAQVLYSITFFSHQNHAIYEIHTLVAGLLARSQYPEGPATGHLDTGFSWFPCV
jgi:hypothetical protein